MIKRSKGAKAHSSDPGKNSDLFIDFAIVTAIEIEKDAVCKAFKLTYRHRVQKGSRVYWRGRLALKGGNHYEIVVAQPPDMAQVDAAILTNDLIHHWDPAALLMVGIAGAASDGSKDDDEALGDLVVGRDVYYYERGKVTADGKRPEPVTYRADATLLNSFMSLPPLRSRIPVSRPDGQQKPPRVIPAAIASGEKVIADAAVRDQIVNHHRKTRAIEMEGYGFSAAVWQSFEQRRHLVIKAICDRADRNKGEDWQQYAAAVAAQYARHFLRDRPIDPRNKKTEYSNKPLPLLAEQAKSFTQGVNGVSLEMILIPSGEFKMGSPEGKGSHWEWPEHEVTVDDFYIGKYPITQAQWEAVMGGNPSHFKGNKNLPVENVSWNEAKKFCANLSLMIGREIRLPSEAEWEYACRAGTAGDHAGRLDEMAWYRENSGEETHPVGEKQPNVYGVYDMHGNVWEWCEDVWHSNYEECPSDSEAWWSGGDSGQRVKRGGCWADYETSCRSANRSHGGVHERGHYCGFRVACALKTHAKQTASSNAIFTGPVTINLSPPSSQQVEKRSQETARPGECRAFNLPHLRNEYFTGREEILQGLEDGFKGGRLVQAISGIGGIGKTQTAQEYAYRHRGSYKTILWGKATTREMLTADFAAMAELLDLREKRGFV